MVRSLEWLGPPVRSRTVDFSSLFGIRNSPCEVPVEVLLLPTVALASPVLPEIHLSPKNHVAVWMTFVTPAA